MPTSNRVQVRHLPASQLPKVDAANAPTNASPNRFLANNVFLHSFTSTAGNTLQPTRKANFRQSKYVADSFLAKPRSITIVKQGNEKPHKTITILLNRRTVQTFEQLLADISEAFGYQKNRPEKVGTSPSCLQYRADTSSRSNGCITCAAAKSMASTISSVTVRRLLPCPRMIEICELDDVFVAVTHNNDISSVELHEITLGMFTDAQQSPSRRAQPKKNAQSSVDGDTSITELSKHAFVAKSLPTEKFFQRRMTTAAEAALPNIVT